MLQALQASQVPCEEGEVLQASSSTMLRTGSCLRWLCQHLHQRLRNSDGKLQQTLFSNPMLRSLLKRLQHRLLNWLQHRMLIRLHCSSC